MPQNFDPKGLDRKQLALALCCLAAVYGLWQVAPAFRPKHVRDILLGLFNVRGVGIVVNFALALLLLPAAARLKQRGFCQLVFEGFVLLLGALFALDITLAVFKPHPRAAEFVLRGAYLATVIWGFFSRPARTDVAELLYRPISLFREIPHAGLKILFGLVIFFLLRQEGHSLVMRGIPFVPFEDETAWWYPLSLHTLNGGLSDTARAIAYTPGVGWLASLAGRLTGWHQPEWFMAFPLMVFAGAALFMLEACRRWQELVISFFIWAYALFSSRDLHHLYGGMLYGEAIDALLLAGYVSMASALWFQRQSLALKAGRAGLYRRLLGFGMYCGFCTVVKPPLSVLALAVSVPTAFALAYFIGGKGIAQKARVFFAYLVPATYSYAVWSRIMASTGAVSEHSFSGSTVKFQGVDLGIPLGILSALFNFGTPQFAWSTALVLAFICAALLKSERFLKLGGLTLLAYWGFVLVLYATLWQNIERYSAGRYMSQAAFALIYILPLALSSSKRKGA